MRNEAEAFDLAVAKTIGLEGDPNTVAGDKGGTTKFGISKAFLQSISNGPVTSAFVLTLSYTDAKEIYRVHFWHKPKIHRIPDDQLREIVFDQGVNRGTHDAVCNLQKAIISILKKNLAIDGVLGPKTIDAIHSLGDMHALVLAFIRESQLAYIRIVKDDVTQLKFLSGWIDRTWKYF